MSLTLGFVPYGTGVREPFDTIFDKELSVKPAHIERGDIDCLVIWGGSDISPSIYNEAPTQHCGAWEELSKRDQIEVDVCKAAITAGVPILGICRGAQLACALAGGKLAQHVTGHAGNDHYIKTNDGRVMVTSSVHHQMMWPFGLDPSKYKLIAETSDRNGNPEQRSHCFEGIDADDAEADIIEPEILYFPDIKALAIQGHPEFMHPDCDFVNYSRELVRKYLLK